MRLGQDQPLRAGRTDDPYLGIPRQAAPRPRQGSMHDDEPELMAEPSADDLARAEARVGRDLTGPRGCRRAGAHRR
jgi:hypothetical protein